MSRYQVAQIQAAKAFEDSPKRERYRSGLDGVWKSLALVVLTCPCLVAQSLPPGEARTLDGEPVRIPEVFARRPTILILGFSRKATTESKIWSKQLFAAERSENADAVYGLVLLSDVPGFLRGVVTRIIRNDVPPNVRSHFLTVTENADAWRELAQVSQMDDIYLVIVDGQGLVSWREHGAYTDERLKAATQAFQQIKNADSAKRASKSASEDRSAISKPGWRRSGSATWNHVSGHRPL